ncbi:hypothetical protein ACFUTR_02155 [Streptomyces sp. NPDC057367]|uniref:hypothetical protein n=1 Tax=Streptomyces sp. NPDC057367 TaxID=3346108 RepID=UPI003631E602
MARSTVKQILPDARSAEERGRSTDQGRDFVFFCRVLTSDDHIVSGESELQDATSDEWLSGYEQEAGDTYGQLREAAGRKGVKTLTLGRLASVYMPCSIAGGSAKRSLRQYALITEARVIGESRAQGNELREALTEFAVQMSEHAYTVGKCNKA